MSQGQPLLFRPFVIVPLEDNIEGVGAAPGEDQADLERLARIKNPPLYRTVGEHLGFVLFPRVFIHCHDEVTSLSRAAVLNLEEGILRWLVESQDFFQGDRCRHVSSLRGLLDVSAELCLSLSSTETREFGIFAATTGGDRKRFRGEALIERARERMREARGARVCARCGHLLRSRRFTASYDTCDRCLAGSRAGQELLEVSRA